MALRSVSNIVCSTDFTVCINHDKNVVSFGISDDGAHGHEKSNVFPPKIIPLLNNIKLLSVGEYHCGCLDNDGNVFMFGNNEYGQLGIGDEDLSHTSVPQKVDLPPCKDVSCGFEFTMCLSETGEVYSFGRNKNGELGIGNTEESYYSPQLISSLKDVEFIESGGYHTFCKTLNNEVFCWGDNKYGQLGLENRDKQNTPILCSSLSNEEVVDIKCGNLFTIVLTSNGDVFSCGNNYKGQLGRITDDSYSSVFQKIENLPEITRIECGDHHPMYIDINNNFYVVGYNKQGQLGLGDTSERVEPIKHPSLSNIIDISSKGNSTFVKTSNNEIYAFGNNEFSQLGIKKEDENQLTPIRVFEDNEDIWFSNINKSKTKSARF